MLVVVDLPTYLLLSSKSDDTKIKFPQLSNNFSQTILYVVRVALKIFDTCVTLTSQTSMTNAKN